jgi:MYXO-CTERM domain-containing protein
MSTKLGALSIAGALFLMTAGAMADVAGGPAGGTGGGGAGGGGTGGGTTTTSDTTKKGGCSAATPDGGQGSAALLVGLGLLAAIPALRRRRDRKDQAPRG